MMIRRLLFNLLRLAFNSSTSTGEPTRDQARAKEYNDAKQRLVLAGMILSFVGGGIVIFGRIGNRFDRRISRVSSNRFARRTIFTAVLTILDLLASLPLGFYSGYVLEHRYQLSNQTKRAWLIDQGKGLILALPFAALVANVLQEIIERSPKRWWLITTGLALPFTVLLSQLAPVLIAPLFNRYEALKDEELAARLKALAARSGINVANVLQMDMSRQTKKANAFFAGMGRTRRIVLADTLLENFTPAEIEVIVAHEIGHQAHRDLWRFVALGTIFTAGLSFVVDVLANQIVRRYGRKIDIGRLSDVTALPLLSWLLTTVGLALAPLQNLYSRIIERRADTYALELTNNPAAFETAMQRLGELNLADPSPSKFVKYTMYSHPPIAERIERAKRYANEARIPTRE